MTIICYIFYVCYFPLLYAATPSIQGVSYLWISLFLLIFVFFIRSISKAEIEVRNIWIISLFFFTVIVFTSLMWSSNYSYDLFNIQRLFARYIVPFLISVMAVVLFKKRANVRHYVRHISIVALLMSALSFYQAFFGRFAAETDFRSSGTFQNPNVLAVFLVLTIPCLIYSIQERICWRWLSLTALASVVGGIICTVSRKGMITMLFSFFLFFLLRKQYKAFFFVSFGFLVLATLVLRSGGFVSHRFFEDHFVRNIEGRGNAIHNGLIMMANEPIKLFMGFGYGGYTTNLRRMFKIPSYERVLTAHNVYITILVNYGIVGFFAFIMIFLFPLKRAFQFFWQAPEANLKHAFLKDMAIICIVTILPFMFNIYFTGGEYGDYFSNTVCYTQISLFLASLKSEENFGGNESLQSGDSN
ncbi:O-antigen polymerase [delta proteobacterium NaphS2]|nr:O-antigen polymerase [delta proteobacterium NaphS2]